MNINLELLIPLIVTTTFGIVGYFIAHQLSSARDRVKKRQEIRLQYLIDAFRALIAIYAHSDPKTRPVEIARAAEKALCDVQIFGTKRQIKLFQDLAQTMNPEELLIAVRNELRRELQLADEKSQVMWLRFEHKNDA